MGADDYRALEATAVADADKAVPTATATPMISVVAPAELPEGYTFDVNANGSTVTVAVPQGGVKEGQQFMAPVVSGGDGINTTDFHKVPHGKWRDGLCNCFGPGVCHPSLCLTFWCAPISLAQVMTRVGLDWCGQRKGPAAASSTFKKILCLFIAYFVVDQVLVSLMRVYAPEYPASYNDDAAVNAVETPSTAYLVLESLRLALRLAFFLYMLIIMIRTRAFIRESYNIPQDKCSGCEDCCCAYWCSCCTIAQMSRHTADYDTYDASCCTETGLPVNTPPLNIAGGSNVV